MKADKAEGFRLLMTGAKMFYFFSLLLTNRKCNVHAAAINLVLNFFAVTHLVLVYTVARLRVLFYKAKKDQRIQKYIKHLQTEVLEKQFSK